MQFDPHHLSALTAVLRLGSFELAAADLAVTPSAISQRIKALEERVGTSLINRGSPCTGTSSGRRLAKHAEDVGLLEGLVARDLALTGAATQGPGTLTRLRIAVNADSLATWFVAAMAAVEGVLFDLVIDDQSHSADWLKRGEVSAAITLSGKPAPGCDAIALGSLRYIATASPDFMQRWFTEGVNGGVNAASLHKAPCLVFNAKDTLQSAWIAAVFGQRLSPPCHFLPSSQGFVDAARAGIGWGMNPEVLVRDHIRKRHLVALLADAPLDVPLTWQVSRIMAQSLKPVTLAVRAAAKTVLVPDGKP
ncbi:MAG: LysR family transcriptional regulator ArgP [Rhodobacteraceae bacterium]|nr:LysR family transcriptional regulator ArgP [Paracoccaceae bacterium]